MPPDTTVVFFAREDSRVKAPKRLHQAVSKAGGDVSAEENVKPWELPKWVIERAAEMELTLEPDAARALVQHVGDRQQRLLRELEKLALGAEPGARIEPPRSRSSQRHRPSAGRGHWPTRWSARTRARPPGCISRCGLRGSACRGCCTG